MKGAGAGLAKGTGATVGAAGQGVWFALSTKTKQVLTMVHRLEKAYLVLEKAWTQQCKCIRMESKSDDLQEAYKSLA